LSTDPLDRVPCGVLVCAPDGRITAANATVAGWTGFGRDDLVGNRTFADLLSVGGRMYLDTHLVPTLRMQGHVEEIALELVRADGSRLPVLVNASLGPAAGDGAPDELRIALFAARDRRSYEQQLLQAKQQAEASERRATQLAETLQRTLIPPAPAAVPGLDLAAEYRPAGRGDEVGGDFYDVFEIGDDDWVAVVGDVCGKGAAAAVVTAFARHAVRALAVRERSPSRVLAQLNDLLLRSEHDRFCTVVLVRLHRVGGRWTATIACGGHPLPVVTAAGGPRRAGHPGPLLGVFDHVEHRDEEIELGPGDTLVLFTDGVLEARHGDELYGDQRLAAWLAAHPGGAEAVSAGLLDEVLGFQGGVPRDDIVILAVRVP
jgi:sigma-B regulation protein RsbU (phosphoserine phosphatase)